VSNRREILKACLKPEPLKAGFYLEDDEDFVYLRREDQTLAVWNAGRVTTGIIQAEADRLMAIKHRVMKWVQTLIADKIRIFSLSIIGVKKYYLCLSKNW
jgi:hypothetical protein